jgi:hypothetical protein
MKKLLAISITVLAATALSGCTLLYPNWGTDVSPSDSAAPSASSSPIESPSESASATPSTAPVLAKAEVVVFDAGLDTSGSAPMIFAMADIANFAEAGGKCILTFTGSGVTKSVEVTGLDNVNRTQCPLMQMPAKGLPKGAGILTVQYVSTTHAGIAPSVSVVIP